MRTRERRAGRGARKAEIGFFEDARSSLAVERRGKTRRVSGARAEGRRRASRRARGARVRRRGAHLDVRHGYPAVLELLDAEERLRELLVLHDGGARGKSVRNGTAARGKRRARARLARRPGGAEGVRDIASSDRTGRECRYRATHLFLALGGLVRVGLDLHGRVVRRVVRLGLGGGLLRLRRRELLRGGDLRLHDGRRDERGRRERREVATRGRRSRARVE